MFTNQGTVIHFNNPKVQASLAANTFTITGHAENKQLTEMLPGILNQLGADSLTSLRRLAETLPKPGSQKTPQWAVSISSIVRFSLNLCFGSSSTFHSRRQQSPHGCCWRRGWWGSRSAHKDSFFLLTLRSINKNKSLSWSLSWSMKPMKFLLGTFIKDFF